MNSHIMVYSFRALSFYKGILPPILAETPKRAVKFFTFEQYKKMFLFGATSPTPLVKLASSVIPVIQAKLFLHTDRSGQL